MWLSQPSLSFTKKGNNEKNFFVPNFFTDMLRFVFHHTQLSELSQEKSILLWHIKYSSDTNRPCPNLLFQSLKGNARLSTGHFERLPTVKQTADIICGWDKRNYWLEY